MSDEGEGEVQQQCSLCESYTNFPYKPSRIWVVQSFQTGHGHFLFLTRILQKFGKKCIAKS